MEFEQIKVAAYAEGMKRALIEHGVDERTASMQSDAFVNEKLSGIRGMVSAIGQGVRRAGKSVAGKASKIKGDLGVLKEFDPQKYRKVRNIGIGAAGATAVGAGALGVHAARKN